LRSWHRWEDGPLSANAKPVIGLVGFYRYGNFGDDLYCHLFATFLRGLGYPVRMYALDNSYLRVEGAETIDELPTFLDSIGVLVYGGGGLLIKGSPFRTPAKWLEELAAVLAR
jgi:hypothetical protein